LYILLGLVATPFIAIAVSIVVSYAVITPNARYIIDSNTENKPSERAYAGLVLGAGINADGKPYKELKARLDVAADALEKGYVDKLIVSGDNRFKNYNEPKAMKDYLVSKGIDAKKVQPDFAGRSTYESCERATKIFNQKKLIIISAESHLSRAIYLCRHMGIESYGIASDLEANNSTRREALARVKALYNVYIHPEPTALGKPINL
jgi:vancomycin permeability regulator SanA